MTKLGDSPRVSIKPDWGNLWCLRVTCDTNRALLRSRAWRCWNRLLSKSFAVR